MKAWMKAHPKMTSVLLWVIAIAITGTYVSFENDPYDPLSGQLALKDGTKIEYEFTRSQVIGRDLDVSVDAPEGTEGYVEYVRVNSDDRPTRAEMDFKEVDVGGHGETKKERLLSASLPTLKEMAGKYAYTVHLNYKGDEYVIDDGKGHPIIPRYRGDVPAWVIIPHVITIILSMLLGIRAALEAFRPDAKAAPLMWATIVTLILGAFIFGPLMQKYAFGVLWAGVPLGWDLTDNKVTIELLFWAVAVYFNTGKRRDSDWSNRSIALAGAATFAIYMIPHSLLGSGFNYKAGGAVTE